VLPTATTIPLHVYVLLPTHRTTMIGAVENAGTLPFFFSLFVVLGGVHWILLHAYD